jgi:hypothetical protein
MIIYIRNSSRYLHIYKNAKIARNFNYFPMVFKHSTIIHLMPRKGKIEKDAKTHCDPEIDITEYRIKILKKANKNFKDAMWSMRGKLKAI